jgi:hypothetical protein
MMKRRATAVLALLSALSLTTVPAFPQRPVDFAALPDWTTAPRPDLDLLAPGIPVVWDLTPRGPAKPGAGGPSALRTAAAVLISVRKDASLMITLTATRGVPVIFVADAPLHPLDRDAAFLSTEGEPIPANPVAFAIGANGRASVALLPAGDGVWQVWVWVLRGGLEPPPAEETDPEALKVYEAMGFTAGQVAVMSTEPDFVRAWNARDGDVIIAKSDKPSAWTKSHVELSLSAGPGDAPRPEKLLRTRQASLFPEGQETVRKGLEKWQKAVDELGMFRGEAIAWARAQAGAGSVLAGRSLKEIIDALAFVSQHPDILEPLLRRDNERQRWSARTLAASSVLELSKGTEAELSILPTKASKTLARLMRGAGAIDAVVIDRGGEVLAATNSWVLPALTRQPGWEVLEKASDGEALVTPPFEEKGLGFLMRKVAVPVRDTTGGRLIGWLLAKVYAGPLPR